MLDVEKVLQSYSPETISRVIHICDNLFYNNYLQSGVLNTREEIQARIKAQVEETCVDFWGQSHAQHIHDKINSVDMRFIYQTIGPRNSIEEFLKETKIANFNNANGVKFYSPQDLAKASNLLYKYNQDIRSALMGGESYYIMDCLRQMGVSRDEIFADDSLARLVSKQIVELGNAWESVQYSSNPELNANMQFLEEFVGMFRQNAIRSIAAECKAKGKTNPAELQFEAHEQLYVNYGGVRLDPIALTTAPRAAGSEWDLFRNDTTTEAFVNNNKMFLGVLPPDMTILHEFIHIIDGYGFDKEDKRSKSTYSTQFRENQMFNESITDYFAMLMVNARKQNNKGVIVKDESFESTYSQLFGVLEGFLTAYLPELKETRLRKFPTEEFERVVGKEQFETISLLCNELIGLNHDRMLHEWAQARGLPMKDFLEKYNRSLYGPTDVPLSKIDEFIDQSNSEIANVFEGSLTDQPLLKRLGMMVRSEGRDLAEKLKGSNKPFLQKFAQLLYSASDKIGAFTLQHGARTLEPPIESLESELQDSNELESDAEMVMTMKPNN